MIKVIITTLAVNAKHGVDNLCGRPSNSGFKSGLLKISLSKFLGGNHFEPNLSLQPNQDSQIKRKPDGRIFDQTAQIIKT